MYLVEGVDTELLYNERDLNKTTDLQDLNSSVFELSRVLLLQIQYYLHISFYTILFIFNRIFIFIVWLYMWLYTP